MTTKRSKKTPPKPIDPIWQTGGTPTTAEIAEDHRARIGKIKDYILSKTTDGEKIVESVVYLLSDSDGNVRIKAATWLRDTCWGKPAETVNHTGEGAGGIGAGISLTEIINAVVAARQSRPAAEAKQ